MKKVFIILAILATTLPVFSQQNRTINDEEKGEILFGYCTRDAIMATGDWWKTEYDSYTVNVEAFNLTLPEKFDSVQIFMGSWCEDSHREVPRFCKIFDMDYFKDIPITFICLNGQKNVDVVDVEEYYVQFVPTIIFYKKGEELCRIIERPRTDSLESDIEDLMERMQ